MTQGKGKGKMGESTMSATHKGPNPGALAIVFAMLFNVGLSFVLSFSAEHPHFPGPWESAETITAYFRGQPNAVLICAVLQFGSAIPLGIFTASMVSRLRFLGVRAAGAEIALFGGLMTAFNLGDNDFANPLNAEGRRRTAESEYTSYGELEAVRTGKKSLSDVQHDGYGVNATVPEFDPAYQKKMEEQTKDIGLGNIFGTLGTFTNINLALYGYGDRPVRRGIEHVGHKIGQGWDVANAAVGTTLDATGDAVHKGWNGAVELGTKAWNGANHGLEQAGHGAADLGGRAWNGTNAAIGTAVDATDAAAHNGWNGAVDLGTKAWNGANHGLEQAGRGAADLGGRVRNGANSALGKALDFSSDAATKAWKWATHW